MALSLALIAFSCPALAAQPPGPKEFGDPQSRREERRAAQLELPLDLPGPERLFRRETETEVFERIRQQDRQSGGSGRVLFPERTPVTKDTNYVPMAFPVSTLLVEPAYVSHGRLFFEQRDYERHAWDLGVLQSPVCLGRFWFDCITLPYHSGTRPFQRYDTSAGKCIPGDPTPMYLYPPEFSLTGLILQAGSAAAIGFIFP